MLSATIHSDERSSCDGAARRARGEAAEYSAPGPPNGMSTASDVGLTLLRLPPVASAGDSALLTNTEMVRAARFFFDRDRSAFITTRAALRRLLGAACGAAPESIELATDSFDRPHLAGEARRSAPNLDFNVSHSGTCAGIALSSSGRVGIDLEYHGQMHALRDLEATVMGSRERLLLATLGDDDHARAFLGCWTRKEAIVKAIGVGLSYPVTTIDIPTVPRGGAVEFTSEDGRLWSVGTVDLDPGVTMSLALAGRKCAIASTALQHAEAMWPTVAAPP